MIFNLVHPEARARAIQAVKEAPEGYRVTIKEQTRNLDQNAIFHALCNDLERSGLEWAGKPRKLEDWKALLVSGHAIATKQGGEVIPGIEGEFVAIRESTARMGKRRASSLIEYTQAFIAALDKN
ncbi:MAG: recombination protein NinB [Patescibacteria group bacterium]|nr:recombination protein NinB [Patescibacteria group bacterium]